MDQTALADESGNRLGMSSSFSQALADGQAPTVLSANVTGGNALTITYSEPVTRVPAGYASLSLTPGGARGVTGPSGAASATHAVSFDGAAAATSATGTLTMDQTALADESGNRLGMSSSFSQALGRPGADRPVLAVTRVPAGYASLSLTPGARGVGQAPRGLVRRGGGGCRAHGHPHHGPDRLADESGNRLDHPRVPQALLDGRRPSCLPTSLAATP